MVCEEVDDQNGGIERKDNPTGETEGPCPESL